MGSELDPTRSPGREVARVGCRIQGCKCPGTQPVAESLSWDLSPDPPNLTRSLLGADLTRELWVPFTPAVSGEEPAVSSETAPGPDAARVRIGGPEAADDSQAALSASLARWPSAPVAPDQKRARSRRPRWQRSRVRTTSTLSKDEAIPKWIAPSPIRA